MQETAQTRRRRRKRPVLTVSAPQKTPERVRRGRRGPEVTATGTFRPISGCHARSVDASVQASIALHSTTPI